MAVEYMNRKGKTNYLHVGKTKTGKPKYYFSGKMDGELADEIPKGFEIYEHPGNAQVFLRKKLPQFITDLEKKAVERKLKNLSSSKWYLVDIKGKELTIYESNQDIDRLREIFGPKARSNDHSFMDDILGIAVEYSPIMKYILEDEEKRTFVVMRYCFLGSIDDWIQIGGPGSLKDVVKNYINHLGQESLFELF
jgi:hypothetical protein